MTAPEFKKLRNLVENAKNANGFTYDKLLADMDSFALKNVEFEEPLPEIPFQMITLKGKPISTNSAYRYTAVGGFARSYLSKEAIALKTDYQWQAKGQWRGKKLLYTPLELLISVYLPTKRITDWDNLHKLSMDSCNGIIWKDDKQIWKATVSRFYDPKNPRIELTITETI